MKNFTNEEKNDKIMKNDFGSLPEENKKNILSALNAVNGGYISKDEFRQNAEKNGAKFINRPCNMDK